ncbi:MAG: hypothetical protein NC924_02690 [Candidatus Omnitrophica bacterium]|nr:hypothetical protein [Candidatus Omnitrophota bacterium]
MQKKIRQVLNTVIVGGMIFGFFVLPAPAADNVPAKQTAAEEKKADTAAMPFIVYRDNDAPENRFYPTEFMGDAESLRVDTGCAEQAQAGTTCVRVAYSGAGPYGWAGLYWVNPAGSWGDKKSGYDLRAAKKLTFWARGEKGGEHIAVFRLGGAFGMYMDSDIHGVGPLTLTKEWQQYTIDVSQRNLKYISAGFGFALTKKFNPDGGVFFIDSVQYE